MSAAPCPARPWEAAWAAWTWPEEPSSRDSSRRPAEPLTTPTPPCGGKVSSPLQPGRQRGRHSSESTRRTGERPGRSTTTITGSRVSRSCGWHRSRTRNSRQSRDPRTRRRLSMWRSWSRAPLLPARRRRTPGRQRRSARHWDVKSASTTAHRGRTRPPGPTGILTGTPSMSTAGAPILWRRSFPTS